MPYDPHIREEELKNRVAADLFPSFDCARILGDVDFCVQPKDAGPTLWETESLLWAEAKNGVRSDFAPLFAQLVLTIGGEKTFETHSPPPFLGAFDSEKIAFLPWHAALDLFFRPDIDWTATPSNTEAPAFRHVLGLLRPILDANLVLFRFGDPDLPKFVKKNLFAGNTKANRLNVTRNNFPFVYQKWVKAVKPSIAVNWDLLKKQGIHDADFFLADLLSKDNATLMQKLFVVLRGNHYLADRQLDPSGLLIEKRVDIMRERIRNGAALLESHVFQFDFLNGSFDDLPDGLRDIIGDPEKRKKLVVFINPPYAEAASTRTTSGTGTNKPGVATEHSLNAKYKPLIGAAANELFALFLLRVAREIPGCVLGQFSKLKHVLAPNFKAFREVFKADLKKAFLVPAKTFDNVSGEFPIGFFVWRTGNDVGNVDVAPPVADVYDANGEFIGTKRLVAVSRDRVINSWLHGFFDPAGENIGWLCFVPNDFQHNKGVFITSKPSESLIRESRVAAITKNNFLVIAIYLAVRHSIEANWLNDRDQFLWPSDSWKTDHGFQLDCLVFTLFHGQNRISCKAGVNHWIPFSEDEVDAKDAYKSHFMVGLLSGCGRLARGEGNVDVAPPDSGHLFTGPEPDLFAAEGCEGGAAGKDLKDLKDFKIPDASVDSGFSQPARAVLDAGRLLYRHYHAQPGALPDASFYDIRAHFQGFKPNGHMNPDSPDPVYTSLVGDLRAAMKALAAHIAPKVYKHGFLR